MNTELVTITPDVIEAWMTSHYAQGIALARSRGAGDYAEDVIQVTLMYALGRTVSDPIRYIARGIKLQTWREQRRNQARALREQAYGIANPPVRLAGPDEHLAMQELLDSLSEQEYDAVLESTEGIRARDMASGGAMRLSRLRRRLAEIMGDNM